MKTRLCVKCGQDEEEGNMYLLIKNSFGLCVSCNEELYWEEKDESEGHSGENSHQSKLKSPV